MRFTILGLCLLAIVGCDKQAGIVIDIKNSAEISVRNIRFNFAGESTLLKELAPNSSFLVSGDAKREGVLGLEYELNGKRIIRTMGYIDKGIKKKCHVILLPNSKSIIDCKFLT
jgi:hypothetical protein